MRIQLIDLNWGEGVGLGKMTPSLDSANVGLFDVE